MGDRYQGYEKALKFLKLDSLKERREKMALKFAKKIIDKTRSSRSIVLVTVSF